MLLLLLGLVISVCKASANCNTCHRVVAETKTRIGSALAVTNTNSKCSPLGTSEISFSCGGNLSPNLSSKGRGDPEVRFFLTGNRLDKSRLATSTEPLSLGAAASDRLTQFI